LEQNVQTSRLALKGIALMTRNAFVCLASFVCLSIGLTVQAQDAPKPKPPSNKIEAVEIKGAKRVPEDTLKSLVTIKPGDTYDEKAVRRDFDNLWNTGRFSDITVKKDTGDRGGVVIIFIVTERSN
jgi:outer membrane protein assembly factor BamA